MAKLAMMSDELLAALVELTGSEPGMIRRVVIDINAGAVPIVHIERFVDDKVLRVVRALDGIEISTEAVTETAATEERG